MGGIGFPAEVELDDEGLPYVIRGVEVEVHQKKDHPHEHGHYDATVRLTADVMPGPDPRAAMSDLLDLAQEQVKAEIGRWLRAVQEARGGETPSMAYSSTNAAAKGRRQAPGRSGKGQETVAHFQPDFAAAERRRNKR